jgi:5-(carboxyamino)imidazole ribonucleotide synthase
VLCVEFFVLADGSLVVNEMAPRPHNSGHYTMEACDVSQFELQVRTLAGLPLAAPRQHSPAIMLNLLGDLWFTPAGPTSRHAALERRAGAARRAPAPLRQGRAAPRPQDGPPDLHRRHARSVRAAGAQAAALLGLPALGPHRDFA